MSESFSTITFSNRVNYSNLHVLTCLNKSTDYWQKMPKILMNSNAKFNLHLVRAVRWATLQQQLQIKTIIQEMHRMGFTSPAFT